MSTQLELAPDHTFNFFRKAKKNKNDLFGNLWIGPILPILLCSSIVLAFGTFAERKKADTVIISNSSQQEYISNVLQKSLKDITISLDKKDWDNTQYHLMRLSQLKSSKVDENVLGLFSDYAVTNFKSKKIPYSNEFSLLATNYLLSIGMQKGETNEVLNIKKLESTQTILPNAIVQSKLVEEKTNDEKSKKSINKSANLLIEGLKESKNKKLLLRNFHSSRTNSS